MYRNILKEVKRRNGGVGKQNHRSNWLAQNFFCRMLKKRVVKIHEISLSVYMAKKNRKMSEVVVIAEFDDPLSTSL